jgi:hypothetical protein
MAATGRQNQRTRNATRNDGRDVQLHQHRPAKTKRLWRIGDIVGSLDSSQTVNCYGGIILARLGYVLYGCGCIADPLTVMFGIYTLIQTHPSAAIQNRFGDLP